MAIVLSRKGGGGSTPPPSSALFVAYAYLREEQAAATSGGDFNSGAWRTRTLNTEVFDPDGIVTLAANQFTLAAGTYYISARSPVFQVNRNKAKIRNTSDGTDAIIGASAYSASTSATQAICCVAGRITIAASKTFELQHQAETTKALHGFGVESNFGVVEVYAEVEIYQEA